MYYFSFLNKSTQSENHKSDLIEKLLIKLTKSNIHNVSKWLIEFDNENEYVNKEIGLDEKGIVIYKAPTENEYGYWSDTNLQIADFEKFAPTPILNEEFENYWIK